MPSILPLDWLDSELHPKTKPLRQGHGAGSRARKTAGRLTMKWSFQVLYCECALVAKLLVIYQWLPCQGTKVRASVRSGR
jgi:hypothetical protein